MTNQLYEIPLRVLPTSENTEVPKTVAGAEVICYAAAPDFKSALQKAAAKLNDMGWNVDDISGNIRELPAEKWELYVSSVWPDYQDHFPTADEIPQKIAEGAVFFGVFATFDRSAEF
jgi:hypothetical protein